MLQSQSLKRNDERGERGDERCEMMKGDEMMKEVFQGPGIIYVVVNL